MPHLPRCPPGAFHSLLLHPHPRNVNRSDTDSPIPERHSILLDRYKLSLHCLLSHPPFPIYLSTYPLALDLFYLTLSLALLALPAGRSAPPSSSAYRDHESCLSRYSARPPVQTGAALADRLVNASGAFEWASDSLSVVYTVLDENHREKARAAPSSVAPLLEYMKLQRLWEAR
jgi:hypothetical protein